MTKEEFEQLLKKYLDGRCTEEEKTLLHAWYEQIDVHTPQPSGPEMAAMETRLWNMIAQEAYHKAPTQETTIIPHNISYKKWRPWLAAAACIAAIAITLFLWNKSVIRTNGQYLSAQLQRVNGMQEANNNTTLDKRIVLDDSSSVLLHPGARLAYPKTFAQDRRVVYLDGEAFFEVSKNKARPFFVYTRTTVTRVLGTSFTVQATGKQVLVAVKTGRVAVYENAGGNASALTTPVNSVIITPNQQTTFNINAKSFETKLVANPAVVSATENVTTTENFVFKEAPILLVLERVSKAYNVHFVTENDAFAHCTFTGDISDPNLTLYQKLEIISLSLGGSYEVKGLDVVLKGKGCNQ